VAAAAAAPSARGLVPNRDSSASLNMWLGRDGSRPASVQGEDALGPDKARCDACACPPALGRPAVSGRRWLIFIFF